MTGQRAGLLLKGLVSGAAWSLIPIFVFGDQLASFHRAWMVGAGCLVGVGLTLLLWYGKLGLTRKGRMLACVPVLLVAEAAWAFLLTLNVTREGAWPERWFELTLGIYWTTIFGLFFLAFVPLTYWNIVWIVKSPAGNG